MNKLIIFAIILSSHLIRSLHATAQESKSDKYVIITFVEKFKISQHGPKSFQWILPQDSIQRGKFKLSPLLLDFFSVNQYKDCCAGKDIDPEMLQTGDTYNLDDFYLSETDAFKALIDKNKIMFQSIDLRWKSGQRKVVEIYVTPVIGGFCNSGYGLHGRRTREYSGLLYIRKSNVVYDMKFSKTLDYQSLVRQDFSKLIYSIIPN